jgi:putative membrane protein
MKTKAANESIYKRVIIAVSLLVPILVVILFYVNPPDIDLGIDLKFFPRFHAVLNSIATVLLLTGLYFIKNKQIAYHRTMMLSAFLVSTIFLLSYVTYHTLSKPTPYGGDGLLRYVYYFILISHVVLAAGVLPFILFTFLRALTGDIEKHRKIARLTLPVWLYVTITGVIVYFLIAPYYV